MFQCKNSSFYIIAPYCGWGGGDPTILNTEYLTVFLSVLVRTANSDLQYDQAKTSFLFRSLEVLYSAVDEAWVKRSLIAKCVKLGKVSCFLVDVVLMSSSLSSCVPRIIQTRPKI